jgi:hypothetical protein
MRQTFAGGLGVVFKATPVASAMRVADESRAALL